MRVAVLIGLLAGVSLVVGDNGCSSHDLDSFFSVNKTSLCAVGGSGIGVAAAAPPPKPPRPPPAPSKEPPPKPASDELWTRCSNKGCTLNWAMQAEDSAVGATFQPPRNTAQSPFQTIDDMKKWFWFAWPREKMHDSFKDLYGTWGIGWALEELGINSYMSDFEGGSNSLYIFDHRDLDPDAEDTENQWYEVDGKSYRATAASYSFTLNCEDGIIIALSRQSPKWAGQDRDPAVPADLLPKLNQFSDIAWIGWQKITQEENHPIKDLRYFLTVGIVNDESQEVIQRAMDQKPWEQNGFPGHTFARGEPEFSALLGTPNVQGFAYFLIQHKAQLGNMFISKLQVFSGDTASKNPCILVHVSQPGAATGAQRVRAARRDSGVDMARTHTVQW